MTAPATEKAAPIPAESFTDRAYEIICKAVGPRQDDWSVFDHAVMDLARDADEAMAQDRADRASQEERIREDAGHRIIHLHERSTYEVTSRGEAHWVTVRDARGLQATIFVPAEAVAHALVRELRSATS